MTPKQRTELVSVTYWTCTVDSHRHKTRRTAEACIAKRDTKRRRRTWTPSSLADVLESVLNGASVRDVADACGISRTRAYGVLRCAVWRIGDPDHPWDISGRGLWQRVCSSADYWRGRIAVARAGTAAKHP